MERRRLLRSRAVPPPAGGWPSARARHKARRTVVLAACGRTHFTVATPAEASGCFKERFSPREKKSGSGARSPCLSIIFTWRSFRAPPAFFCPEADLTAFALRLPAKGLGFMVSAQTAHRHAANPAPSSLHAHPVHDPCSREGDGQSIAQAGTAWRDRRELFSQSSKINDLAGMYIHATHYTTVSG